MSSSKSKIGPGSPAPDFNLPDASGKTVRLSDFRGNKNVVLYFYPKDDTPGCTKEACHFRDQYEDFKKLNAEVIGVSDDSAQSHTDFSSKYKLPFILLSDPKGETRKAYDVNPLLGLLPGRVTFVIDKEGIIRHMFSSQINMKKHVDEAARVLESL